MRLLILLYKHHKAHENAKEKKTNKRNRQKDLILVAVEVWMIYAVVDVDNVLQKGGLLEPS